jgi:hypothetical protein
VKSSGAAARPLAGARVHPMGERAAVELPGGGAHGTGPWCRRGGGEHLLIHAPHDGVQTRTEAVVAGLILGKILDLGFGIFDLSLHRFSSFLPLTRVDLGLG